MAITNGYCTLAEIRGFLGITVTADTTDDTRLEIAVETASRAVDGHCARHLWVDTAATTRYFTALDHDRCAIDDMVTITSLSTDIDDDRDYDDTWATTDYDAEPYNAAADGRPYTLLRKTPLGDYDFPTGRKAVKVVATFGWPSVPMKIKMATMIQASRFFKRKDSPFGVLGSAETGMVTLPQLDPDVAQLVEEFRKREVSG